MFYFLYFLVFCFIPPSKSYVYNNNNTEKVNVTKVNERSFNSACGEVFSDRQFVLESINYPNSYPKKSDCSYLVKGPYCPTYFQLRFLDFNLQDSNGCVKDRLEVDHLDALCGNKYGIKNYFSKTGALHLRFKSDAERSGRGYKILITRLPCGQNPDINNNSQHPYNYLPPSNNNNDQQCCKNSYNSKNILLSSPNFPYTLNQPVDCSYKIYKLNDKVCRLRIEMLFFNLGVQNYNNCPEGFIEIDGKIICGCKSELKLISPFNYGESFKLIKFKAMGLGRDFQTGFLMQVTQDECPKRYKPEKKSNISEKFHFYNDQKNTVAWPHDNQKSFEERLNLINEKTEILDDNDIITKKPVKVEKHYYFFAYPEENNQQSYPKEIEETNFIYTVNIDYILPDTNNINYCQSWNYQQIRNIYAQHSESTLQCNVKEKENYPCVEMDYLKGFFKSPGYPFFYPKNLNICYRFRKQPGFCAIKIYVNDFQLEQSNNCDSTYLSWDNKRKYCGNSLHNTISTVDLSQVEYVEAKFVSNSGSFYCGRGFFGVYEQIACRSNYPINPDVPPTPTPVSCDQLHQERTFVIDIYGYSYDTCRILIKRYDYDVCKVKLTFEKFDLECQTESITIDGRTYCEPLTGKSVYVDLDEGVEEIVYRKTENARLNGLRLRILGEQITDDCIPLEVPAQISRKSDTSETILGTNKTIDEKFLFALKNKNFKDICGIITKTKINKLPSTICNILMSENNATKCLPLTENSLYVPYDSKKLELKIKNANQTEEIEFEEVDCDNI